MPQSPKPFLQSKREKDEARLHGRPELGRRTARSCQNRALALSYTQGYEKEYQISRSPILAVIASNCLQECKK